MADNEMPLVFESSHWDPKLYEQYAVVVVQEGDSDSSFGEIDWTESEGETQSGQLKKGAPAGEPPTNKLLL